MARPVCTGLLLIMIAAPIVWDPSHLPARWATPQDIPRPLTPLRRPVPLLAQAAVWSALPRAERLPAPCSEQLVAMRDAVRRLVPQWAALPVQLAGAPNARWDIATDLLNSGL